MQTHPYADIFPMLEGPAAAELVESMRLNGYDLHHPVITYEGQILDGRNRFRAAKSAGVKAAFAEYTGPDPLGYVVLANLTRRHLSESQRQMCGARLATLGHGQKQSGKLAGLPTQAEAAKLLNTSERGIRSARVVQDTGAPELVAAVDAGTIKVSAAARVAALPKAEQVALVAKVASGEVKASSIGRAAEDDDNDPGPDDDVEPFVADADDDPPVRLDTTEPRKWGEFELSGAVADLVAALRDVDVKVNRIFDSVDVSRRQEFATRAESAILAHFERLYPRLPVTAQRAETNRARMRVLDGGK